MDGAGRRTGVRVVVLRPARSTSDSRRATRFDNPLRLCARARELADEVLDEVKPLISKLGTDTRGPARAPGRKAQDTAGGRRAPPVSFPTAPFMHRMSRVWLHGAAVGASGSGRRRSGLVVVATVRHFDALR